MKMWIMLVATMISTAYAADDELVVFSKKNFFGRAEVILESDADLGDNLIGNDAMRSIRIPPNCEVTLYEHRNYQGRMVTLVRDHHDLRQLGIGGRVSSIHVEWVHDDRLDGVVLFSKSHFRGRGEIFDRDDPDLGNNRVGNDCVRSARIPHGWAVTFYEHRNYRGRYEVLRGDDVNLGNNDIGYGASSVKIRRLPVTAPRRNAAVLFSDSDFSGRREVITDDDPDLSDNLIGNDALSSIRVPANATVILYEHTGYRGRAIRLRNHAPNLHGYRVGNDRVSSIRIEWDRHPRRRARVR